MKQATITALAFLWLALAATASAAALADQRQFGFGAREIYQFGYGISHLNFSDIDGDGLDDVVLVNNRRSRLEILIRRKDAPAAEDKLATIEDVYTDHGFLLDQQTAHLQVADLNGDRRADLVTAGTLRGVRIYFQNDTGGFSSPVSPVVKNAETIVDVLAADFNQDGVSDLLIGRRKNAEVLYNDGRGRFEQRLTVDFTARECRHVLSGDFNGDGRRDIMLICPAESLPLRFFPGRPDGGFGWEYPLDIAETRRIRNMSLGGQRPDQLVAILKNGVNVRLYDVARRDRAHLFAGNGLAPLRTAAKGVGGNTSMPWTMGDINHDGHPDYIAGAPELSRIMVYDGNERGLSPVPHAIDSLRRIRDIGMDRNGDLYVFSPEEKAIACHRKDDLSRFPEFVDLAGEPLVMAVSPARTGFVSIVKRQKDRLYLVAVDRSGKQRAVQLPLKSEKAPNAMRLVPLAPKLWGVILFSPYDQPVMYVWHGRKLEPVTRQQFRALGAGLKPEDISLVDLDEKPALMVSEGQVARLYRYDGQRFVVERQFGLADEKATLRYGAAVTGPDHRPGYLFYNAGANALCWFARDDTRRQRSMSLTDRFDDLTGLQPVATAAGTGLLLPGRAETRWIPASATAYDLEAGGSYASPAENPQLWNLFAVQLGTPARPMAAVLNATNAAIELLSTRKNTLAAEVSFKVFQTPRFNRTKSGSQYEPREVVSGDVNGDGIMDLGILVHDKLVIHRGE